MKLSRIFSVFSHINLLILFLLLLAGCDVAENPKTVDFSDRLVEPRLQSPTQTNDNEREKHYIFGFDLRSSPQEDARQYLPFLNYLQQATGYKFELHLASRNESLDQQLGQGKVQFAAIGAVTHIKTHEHYAVIPLVRGLNSDNKAEYQSVIVVRPDSPIRKLDQLKGKRFAFGSNDSTQGHLIPRIELLEIGIKLEDLMSYGYTGSHQNCANAVIAGRYDACGMQDTMGKRLEQQGLVRIMHVSQYYPSSGISVNKNVPAKVVSKVRQALLDFKPRGKHAAGLYKWRQTEMPNGFSVANNEEYERLRKWMFRLGFIGAAGSSE